MIRGIVAKTIGATPLIAQAFKKVEGISEAYLYGSFARDQQDTASDIDVLVIGNPKGEVLAEAMRRLERQLGREINYTVLTRKELESRRKRKDAFLDQLLTQFNPKRMVDLQEVNGHQDCGNWCARDASWQ